MQGLQKQNEQDMNSEEKSDNKIIRVKTSKWDFSDWSKEDLRGNYSYLARRLLRLREGSVLYIETKDRCDKIKAEMNERGI